MIPTIAECFQLIDQYKMLPNIRAHSIVVARVAWLIGKGLADKGHHISLPLTVTAALLHDIAKTKSLESNLRHDVIGGEICREHGFEELAEIVAEHVILKNGVPENCCAEKEVVYYADKRVRHEEVVSLEERLEYILKRYGNGDEGLHERIKKNFTNAHNIEEKIFQHLLFPPEQIGELINSRQFQLETFQNQGL